MWVDGEPCVTITRGDETAPLNPRLHLAHFSNTGFAWGFAGPASRQLALAILVDYFAHKPNAAQKVEQYLEGFHRCVIASLPHVWVLSTERITDFLALFSMSSPG